MYGADVKLDLDAIMLPLSRGYGSLPSLHLVMSENPVLKQMVRDLPYVSMGEAAARLDAQALSLRTQRKVGAGGTAGNDREWRKTA